MQLTHYKQLCEQAEKAAGLGLWEYTIANNSFQLSDGALSMLGFASQGFPITYHDFIKMFGPEDLSSFSAQFQKVTTAGGDMAFNCKVITNKNIAKHMSFTGKGILGASGNLEVVTGVCTEITDATTTLAKEENTINKLTALVNPLYTAICTLNGQGIIKWANTGYLNVLGYTLAEITGMPLASIIHERDRDDTQNWLAKILAGQIVTNLKNQCITKNNTPVHIVWSAKWDAELRLFYCEGCITEEKTAHEITLEESEKQYTFLFKNSPSIMIVWDFETLNIIDVNEEATVKYGYSREEFLTLNIKQIRPEEDIPLIEAATKNPDAYGTIHKNVWRHKKKNGELMFIEVHARLFWYKGRLVSINNNTDVTERVMAEKALQASEERYRQLFYNSPLPMWIYDLATFKLLEVNDMAIARYGYSREEFLGMTIFDFRPAQQAQQISEALHNLDPTQKIFHFGVYDHLKKDGSLMKADISCFRMPYHQKDCMLVTSFDVTEKELAFQRQKENEQKLLASQNELSLIYNTVSDTIFVLGVENNEKFQFLTINHAFTQATGLHKHAVVGKYVEEVIPQPSLNIVLAKYREAINTKRKITWEETTTYPTGLKTGIVTIAPIFNAEDICVQLIGTITDITEQKAIQTALEQRNVFIEKAIDNLPIGIAVNSINDGTATLMNRKFSEIYGWPAEVLTDVDIFFKTVYPNPQYRQWIEQTVLQDINSKDPARMSWEGIVITTASGEQRIINAKNIPLYDQNLMISTVVDVTENVKAQNDLKISNERFEYATRATSDAIWDWDLVANTLFWGERYSEIFGYPLHGLQQGLASWEENIHPTDKARVIEHIFAVIGSTDNNWQDEYRYRKANGTFAFVIDRGFVIRDENGKAIRMAGSMHDVTARKNEEQQLKLFESVITHTKDAILITEAEPFDGLGPRILYVNQAFTNMTGYTADEVIGKTPRILQGPKSDKNELARLRACLRNWETCEITTINYKKNGDEFWINFSVSPVADANGWFTHWIAVERDVTEQKMTEQSLRIAYKERNDILESIGDAFFAMDSNYLVTYWNNKAETVMKKSRQEIIGRDLREVYPPYPGRTTYFYYEKAKTENKAQYFEAYNADVNSWFEVSVFPSSVGLSVYFRDVTERVAHQKAIEEQNKTLTEIAWMQSHVVRAPLSKIMGLVNLIKDDAVAFAEKESLLAYLATSAQELDKIIMDIANSTYNAKILKQS